MEDPHVLDLEDAAESVVCSEQSVTVVPCVGTCHPACLWKPPQFCKAWAVCIPERDDLEFSASCCGFIPVDFLAQVKVYPRLTPG